MTRAVARHPDEQSLAARVLEHLRAHGWTCYQEVETPHGRCDIVATPFQSQSILAIECKLDLGWDVVRQAARWREHANWVAVATRPLGRNGDEALKKELLQAFNIGWIVVGRSIAEPIKAPPLRTERGELGQYLREEQQHWAPAGNATGQRFTPFGRMQRALEAHVREHDPRPCPLPEIIAAGVIPHRTPKAARPLVTMARKGQLGALGARWNGIAFEFFLNDAVAAESA